MPQKCAANGFPVDTPSKKKKGSILDSQDSVKEDINPEGEVQMGGNPIQIPGPPTVPVNVSVVSNALASVPSDDGDLCDDEQPVVVRVSYDVNKDCKKYDPIYFYIFLCLYLFI